MSFRLSDEEQARLASDGYVVREPVFDAAECAAIAADCEALVEALTAQKTGRKQVVGSYVFEMRRDLSTVVKWEPDAPDLVMGVEFFSHISAPLKAWGLDARLVDPCRELVGEDDIVLFTEKLNLKRARQGGPIILHQDFPYWEQVTPVAARIATAMVFLDEATAQNGCLEVAPGSHREGVQTQKPRDDFGAMEMDAEAFDKTRLIPLEVGPGSVAFFGPFLVHRSLPNRSGDDRRALLYSYQPAGNPHSREMTRPAQIRAVFGEEKV
jgi:ectoine hydroxylase-related dioxygenase (phytanoyl-CoA dioxygenase family)